MRDVAGISASASASDNGGSGGGPAKRRRMGGLLKLDPGLLASLEEKGTEALVVAFVDGGGDVDGSIPGWAEGTKSLQGEVGCS